MEYFVYGSQEASSRVLLQINGSMGTGRMFSQFSGITAALEQHKLKVIIVVIILIIIIIIITMITIIIIIIIINRPSPSPSPATPTPPRTPTVSSATGLKTTWN